MKTFRRLFVAVLLTAALAVPVWAGDVQTPGAPDPGDVHTPGEAAPGDVQTPGLSVLGDIAAPAFAAFISLADLL